MYKYSSSGWVSAATFYLGTTVQTAVLRLDQSIPTSNARHPGETAGRCNHELPSSALLMCLPGTNSLEMVPKRAEWRPFELYKQHE